MINYKNIANSIEYYEKKQYKYIETPWTVTEAISNLTKPGDRSNWKIENKNKVLVGSAEQGFLYLALKGFLAPGKYQSVSPCFRDEIFDLTHSKYFVKNELIVTEDVTEKNLQFLMHDAVWFFKEQLNISNEDFDKEEILKYVPTGKNSFDIEYKGIELGSYGIRETPILTYIYGTACAEPRLSYCQKLK